MNALFINYQIKKHWRFVFDGKFKISAFIRPEVFVQRTRITTEEKAEVVAAVWGTELINSLLQKIFSTRMILKNKENI